MLTSTLPPPPRAIRLTTGAKIGRVFWILLLFVGTFVCMVGRIMASERMDTLITKGDVQTARVLNSRSVHGKSTIYYLSIVFHAGTFNFEGERAVRKDVYDQYAGAQTVPVTCMPGNASDFEIGPVDDQAKSEALTGWSICLFFSFFFGGIFCLANETQIRKEQRLFRFGTECTGTIQEITAGKSNQVKYVYTTTHGIKRGSIYGQATVRTKLAVGDSVAVLYLPAQPDVSIIPDCAQMVCLI